MLQYWSEDSAVRGTADTAALQHSPPCCRYEPAADTWLQLDSMKHGRSSFAIQSVGGDLTAIAGWDVSILWS